MQPFFITGTDTDCGKTYVTCQLLDFLKQKSKTALAVKPIASGCEDFMGELCSEDVIQLQQHNFDASLAINAWSFAPAISPHLAAKQAGISLKIEEIASFCTSPEFSNFDTLLIEGAGGLMAPLNEKDTWLNFAHHTQFPVILVVGMRIGCLNHALLTERALIAEQIPCAGWVANCLDKNMLALPENIDTLCSKLSMPHLATIPFAGKIENNLNLQKIFTF